MKKILASVAVVVLLSVATIAATRAYFSDTETSAGNILSAGSLDLTVNDQDDPITQHFAVSDIGPGYDSGYMVFCLKNVGSMSGQPYVEFSTIVNSELGTTEPEDSAELESYADSVNGELGQYLNYTIGVGPCSWTVPSLLISQWQTGPVHPWGIPGLNSLDGGTYFKGPTGYKFPVLNHDETYGFFIKLSLSGDLRRWDGTKWLDVDDNIIQTDSVEFDIIFHLDQV